MNNIFIYCTDDCLKRRISKVYTFKTGKQYVRGHDGEAIPLVQLSRDYMFLEHFNEENIASVHNCQNSLTWWYKKCKKGIKYAR
ncbi:hypothetical protein DS691_21165 [Salmonella enterica subsp. enterica serovar Bareilly]|nr:hypothetical protein [Salmonella enterica subsp. enterica serovar Bareilly]